MPESGEASVLEMVAVEEVVGVKGDKAAIGMDDVDAGFLDGTDIESIGVKKMDDEDAENVFVAEIGWGGDSREATEKFAEGSRAGLRGVVGCEQLEEAIADARFFFVDDGVARGVDEDIGFDETGERNDFAVEFESVGHGQRVRMARHGDHVFGAKDAGLLQDFATHLGKSEAIRGGVKSFNAAGILDGLQRDTADAGLAEGEVDNFADLAIVEALAEGDN